MECFASANLELHTDTLMKFAMDGWLRRYLLNIYTDCEQNSCQNHLSQ